MTQTIVIGGGIIGASVAYHLAARGAQVTVLTAGRPGGLATAASFAWINAAPDNPRPYYELRLKAILDWHRLQAELGERIRINWRGSISWSDDMHALEARAAAHAAWGYPIHMIAADTVAAQEPGLSEYPDLAAYSPLEGSLSPHDTARALLAAAAERGARINGDGIAAIVTRNGRVSGVRTAAGEIAGDQVVLAAGTACGELAAAAGVTLPMANRLGFLAQSNPLPPVLRGLVLAPNVHIRQNSDGRIIAGADFTGGAAPDDETAAAEALMASVRELLANRDDIQADRHTLGLRPVPADGLPVVGPAENVSGLYMTVMHSGITLAALVGRLAAEEILTSRPVDLLSPYRPARFQGR